MFDDLLLHPNTKKQLEAFAGNPSHALILEGPVGSGREHVLKELSKVLLGAKKLESYPYFHAIYPKNTKEKSQLIRETIDLMVLKVPRGDTVIRRIIAVIDAETLNITAQNAFLKALEEPPLDTCIILTSSGKKLLPTIISRAQTINILPVGKQTALEYYGHRGVPSAEITKNFALSRGQAGLLDSLVNSSEHELKPWVDAAKQILAENAGQRLLRTEALSKDKPGIQLLLDSLARIAHSALQASAAANKQTAVDRWVRVQTLVQNTLEKTSSNVNPKLLLDHLFINL